MKIAHHDTALLVRARDVAVTLQHGQKGKTMASVGDTKLCPECRKKAMLYANVDPTQKAPARERLVPPPMTRRVLVWRCQDETCDYVEVHSALTRTAQ
jgi:hypothetical protein